MISLEDMHSENYGFHGLNAKHVNILMLALGKALKTG